MNLKKAIIIVLVVLFIGGTGFTAYRLFYSDTPVFEKSNQEIQENIKGKPQHITNKKELKKVWKNKEWTNAVKECDCYYTIDSAGYPLGVDESHLSGKVTISKDYYNSLLDNYDDFEKRTGVIDISELYHINYDTEQLADDGFLTFSKSQEYLFSKKYFDQNNIVLLLSESEPVAYILFKSF